MLPLAEVRRGSTQISGGSALGVWTSVSLQEEKALGHGVPACGESKGILRGVGSRWAGTGSVGLLEP